MSVSPDAYGRRQIAGGALGEAFPGLAGFGPGSVLAGYRLEAQIGSGGMAVVFRARDQRLDRPVKKYPFGLSGAI